MQTESKRSPVREKYGAEVTKSALIKT